LKKEDIRRLRLILKTELSSRNKMQATGTMAIPVLRCSFGIINGHQEEIKSWIEEQGRGLIQTEGDYAAEVIKLMENVKVNMYW
jgi:hypothetical protein